jgi:type II secretory pathway predicted ATPase ExeA/cell division septation protein DedD
MTSQWKGHGPEHPIKVDAGVTESGASHAPGAGVLTYEPFYGLTRKPFSLSTDPRGLYKGPPHAAVLEDMLGAIRRREGLIVLTGDMGTGKTMLCRAAIYQLDRKTFTTFVPDPYLSREDLLRMLLVGFGEVSVDDLSQGRLKGAPRADLACRLYEFLTSLESVDAFATLVIDEAQHLTPALADEIRALSEMEAGRRLLQIILVGQRALRGRLTLPEMRHIAQRVTTACDLPPLTREGVSGYVAHRLAAAGGVRDHVAFSSTALSLVYEASEGVPRLVNRICDRALHYGCLDRTSQIGHAQIRRALQELELMVTAVDVPAPVPRRFDDEIPEAPRTSGTPGEPAPRGLFQKTAAEPSPIADDLRALLDLPPVARHAGEPVAAPDEQPLLRKRRSSRGSKWVAAGKTLALPAVATAVVLAAAGMTVSTVAARTGRVELPPAPASPLTLPPPVRPRGRSAAGLSSAPTPGTPARPVPVVSPQQTWVVQVAAFANPERSAEMVQRLVAAGLPGYAVLVDRGSRGELSLVRIGPFASAEAADQARSQLESSADYEGAFVRNITARR